MFRPLAKTITRTSCIVSVFAAAALGTYLGGLQLAGNFHTVVAGELYRSAQPSPEQIAEYSKAFGIRTIVNLRGGGPGQGFYDGEIAASEKFGIKHIDFPLSSSKMLTAEQVGKLITILKSAQRPILVHCKNGADRAGLASALYLLAVEGQKADVADGQLSIVYGHFSVPGFPSYPMDQTFYRYLAGTTAGRVFQ